LSSCLMTFYFLYSCVIVQLQRWLEIKKCCHNKTKLLLLLPINLHISEQNTVYCIFHLWVANMLKIPAESLQNQNKNMSWQSILQKTFTCTCCSVSNPWKCCKVASVILIQPARWKLNKNRASNNPLLTQIQAKIYS